MKKITKRGLLTVMCILMIAFTSVGLAIAYFSDYTTASGQAVISLQQSGKIVEEVDPDGTKHIVILNTGETNLVVRAAIYGPWLSEEDQNKDVVFAAPDDWEYKDGYYYYIGILPPEGVTSEIVVGLENIPEGHENFDITATYQAAIAVYENGAVAAPDGWDYIPSISE